MLAGLWLVMNYFKYPPPATPDRVYFKSLLLFLIPQALFGIYYFGSDTERWVLILPVVWLAVADLASRMSTARKKAIVVLVAVLAAINAVQAFWPAAMDRSIESRVLALRKALPAGSLVITPGDDWLSYYHYYTSQRVKKLTLIEVATKYVNQDQPFFEEFSGAFEKELGQGNPVILLRLFDPTENDHTDPWSSLSSLGFQPEKVRARFKRYAWEERRLSDPLRTRTYWLLPDRPKPLREPASEMTGLSDEST